MDSLLTVVEHRPFPLPAGPWLLTQTWHDLLFAHWPLPPQVLRPLVPDVLPLDTFHGSAWVAVTPFHMSRVRPRGIPALPGVSAFPELNLRTYVRLLDKSGVFFFSLDCANRPAVWTARKFYRLPYFLAEMSVQVNSQEVVYSSRRLEGTPAEFRAEYEPVSTVQLSSVGTLEHFLTERYCLYTVDRGGVFSADIHHLPWPLQQARANIAINTMPPAAGIQLPAVEPLLHFARELKVLIWPLKPI